MAQWRGRRACGRKKARLASTALRGTGTGRFAQKKLKMMGRAFFPQISKRKKFANAFMSFNVKAFTLDYIEALPMDDEQKEEIQEEAEDVDSSEVDSDAAEALKGREYTSLFDRKKVAAAAKPKAKTAA